MLTEQKQNGIFTKIHAEVERRRMLGILGNEPFLVSYRNVGQELQASGNLTPNTSANLQGGAPERNRVLDVRTAKTKTIENNEKAKAASPLKASAKKAATNFNPLSMSDEEFEKNFELSRRM